MNFLSVSYTQRKTWNGREKINCNKGTQGLIPYLKDPAVLKEHK